MKQSQAEIVIVIQNMRCVKFWSAFFETQKFASCASNSICVIFEATHGAMCRWYALFACDEAGDMVNLVNYGLRKRYRSEILMSGKIPELQSLHFRQSPVGPPVESNKQSDGLLLT